jgi:hypothetical protein
LDEVVASPLFDQVHERIRLIDYNLKNKSLDDIDYGYLFT